MLTPVPMLKAEVCVHRDYIDAVLYSLGRQGLLQIDDIRPRLERDKDLERRVSPIEPSALLFELSSLSSRLRALTTTLGVLEKPLDQEMVREISRLLGNLQEQVPTYQALVDLRLRLEYAKTRMARTDETIVFEGWVPAEKAEALRRLVEEASQGNCFIALSAPKVRHGRAGLEAEVPAERPPTLLRNPRIAGVYQKLVTGFGVPNYFELDPSMLWLFTFPIVFGLMFGDLGQGVVLAALAFLGFLLKRRGVKGEELTTYILEGTPIFIMSGVAAALVGFLYGEFFGFHLSAHGDGVYLPGIVEAREGLLEFLDDNLGQLGLHFPRDFHPLKYPTVLLKIAIYMAVIHISLGLVLNLVNKLRRRELMEAVAGPITWLWLYLGGAYLFATYGSGVFSVLFTNIGLAVAFILLPFLVMLLARMKTGGVEGLGEALGALIESLSNTISYARIFAFAMIHSVLNGVFTVPGPYSAIGAIMGAFFFIFFESIFVFFQALRLHWVEFGLKFYSGDGAAFKPFSTEQVEAILEKRGAA